MTQIHPRSQLTRTEIILQLDQEVDRLLQARHLLAGVTDPQPQPDPIRTDVASTLVSTEERLRFLRENAHLLRPAKKQTQKQIFSQALGLVGIRPDAGKIVNLRADASAQPARRQVSPAGRRRMARAQRLRWKKVKQQQKLAAKSQRVEKKLA